MGAFSSREDLDGDGELDERCCLLFFGNYDPNQPKQRPAIEDLPDGTKGREAEKGTAVAAAQHDTMHAGATTDTKAKNALESAAAAAPSAAAESPWVVASEPVFKQYGKLAVRLGTTVDGLQPSGQFLCINDDTKPLKFETPLFYGRVVVRVKGAEGAPPTPYFDSVKREMSVHFEGRFKKRICTNNVVVVAAFERKFVQLPALTKLVADQLQKLCESSKVDVFSDTPCLSAPFVALMDRIEARQEGHPAGVKANLQLRKNTNNAPRERLNKLKQKMWAVKESGDTIKAERMLKQCRAIEKYISKVEAEEEGSSTGDVAHSERGMGPWVWGTRRVEENSALLGGMGRDPANSNQRIRFFDKEENRLAAFFEPDLVYSFDFVEESLSLSKFSLSQGIFNLDFAKCLDGQQLNVEVRVLDDAGELRGTLLRLEFLHEDVCPKLLDELRRSS